MELSPKAVAAATFKTVKRGYDPDEVRAYLVEVSASLESSHQQSTAMEARARAAISKLQDAAKQVAPPANTAVPQEAEVISRTLLLAQRTADTAIAEAQTLAATLRADAEAEATALTAAAAFEAATTIDEANVAAAQLTEDARLEAQRIKGAGQERAELEVQELLVRRQALLSDVDALEQFVADERERLRSVSATMLSLVEASPGGLAAVLRPELSASVDVPQPATDDTLPTEPVVEAPDPDDADPGDVAPDDVTPAEGLFIDDDEPR